MPQPTCEVGLERAELAVGHDVAHEQHVVGAERGQANGGAS